jgi:hypothetical protein
MASEKQITFLNDLRQQALEKAESQYATYHNPADQKSREHYNLYSRVLMAMTFDSLNTQQASTLIDTFKSIRDGVGIRFEIRTITKNAALMTALGIADLWANIQTVWAEVKDADKVVEIVWAAPKVETVTTYEDGLTVPAMTDVLNEVPEPWEYIWRNKGRDFEDKVYLETAEIEANIEAARKEIKGE